MLDYKYKYGFPCPRCGSPMTVTKGVISSPYSGFIECDSDDCSYCTSWMTDIGKRLLDVEELPEPNGLTYYMKKKCQEIYDTDI